MKPWFQIVVALGILSGSVAAAAFTINSYRAYQLERDARQICRAALESNGHFRSDSAAISDWRRLRLCVTDAMYGPGRNRQMQ
jgi:hypothetical protein